MIYKIAVFNLLDIVDLSSANAVYHSDYTVLLSIIYFTHRVFDLTLYVRFGIVEFSDALTQTFH